jgi:hypothetical protein
MKTPSLLLALCAALFLPTVRAAETNAPALTIYRFVERPRVSGEIRFPVIAALWRDGRIVWSESRIKGGPPYQQGRFPREKLDSLLDTLERKQVFRDAAQLRGSFGPDSDYTIVVIEDGRRRLRMESWHELFEQNTNLVATAGGITPLGGARREDVLQKQPETYRRFRDTWSEIRQAVEALIPKTGAPYEGKIQMPEK